MNKVKVNIVGFNSVFTKMRLWRTFDTYPTADKPEHFLGEFPAADHFIDEGILAARIALYPNETTSHHTQRSNFRFAGYLVELETASGIIHQMKVHVSSALMFDGLHTRNLFNPFVHGDMSQGILYPDEAREYIPAEAQVRALIRGRTSIWSSNIGTDASRFLMWNRGSLMIAGSMYVSTYASYNRSSSTLYNIQQQIENLSLTEFNPSYDLIVKDAHWRLHVMDYTEAGAIGLYTSNTAGYNYPYINARPGYPLMIPHSSSSYGYYQYSSTTGGAFTFTTTTSGSSLWQIPAITMRYLGKAN